MTGWEIWWPEISHMRTLSLFDRVKVCNFDTLEKQERGRAKETLDESITETVKHSLWSDINPFVFLLTKGSFYYSNQSKAWFQKSHTEYLISLTMFCKSIRCNVQKERSSRTWDKEWLSTVNNEYHQTVHPQDLFCGMKMGFFFPLVFLPITICVPGIFRLSMNIKSCDFKLLFSNVY